MMAVIVIALSSYQIQVLNITLAISYYADVPSNVVKNTSRSDIHHLIEDALGSRGAYIV